MRTSASLGSLPPAQRHKQIHHSHPHSPPLSDQQKQLARATRKLLQSIQCKQTQQQLEDLSAAAAAASSSTSSAVPPIDPHLRRRADATLRNLIETLDARCVAQSRTRSPQRSNINMQQQRNGQHQHSQSLTTSASSPYFLIRTEEKEFTSASRNTSPLRDWKMQKKSSKEIDPSVARQETIAADDSLPHASHTNTTKHIDFSYTHASRSLHNALSSLPVPLDTITPEMFQWEYDLPPEDGEKGENGGEERKINPSYTTETIDRISAMQEAQRRQEAQQEKNRKWLAEKREVHEKEKMMRRQQQQEKQQQDQSQHQQEEKSPLHTSQSEGSLPLSNNSNNNNMSAALNESASTASLSSLLVSKPKRHRKRMKPAPIDTKKTNLIDTTATTSAAATDNPDTPSPTTPDAFYFTGKLTEASRARQNMQKYGYNTSGGGGGILNPDAGEYDSDIEEWLHGEESSEEEKEGGGENDPVEGDEDDMEDEMRDRFDENTTLSTTARSQSTSPSRHRNTSSSSTTTTTTSSSSASPSSRSLNTKLKIVFEKHRLFHSRQRHNNTGGVGGSNIYSSATAAQTLQQVRNSTRVVLNAARFVMSNPNRKKSKLHAGEQYARGNSVLQAEEMMTKEERRRKEKEEKEIEQMMLKRSTSVKELNAASASGSKKMMRLSASLSSLKPPSHYNQSTSPDAPFLYTPLAPSWLITRQDYLTEFLPNSFEFMCLNTLEKPIERRSMKEKGDLEKWLKALPYLRDFSATNTRLQTELISLCRLQHLKQGEIIYRQGELQSHMYVLIQGEVRVTKTVTQDKEEQIEEDVDLKKAMRKIELHSGNHQNAAGGATLLTQLMRNAKQRSKGRQNSEIPSATAAVSLTPKSGTNAAQPSSGRIESKSKDEPASVLPPTTTTTTTLLPLRSLFGQSTTLQQSRERAAAKAAQLDRFLSRAQRYWKGLRERVLWKQKILLSFQTLDDIVSSSSSNSCLSPSSKMKGRTLRTKRFQTGRYQETAVCTSDQALVISISQMDHDRLIQFDIDRTHHSHIVALRGTKLFQHNPLLHGSHQAWKMRQLIQILQTSQLATFERGMIVGEEDEVGERIYFVLNGTVQVEKDVEVVTQVRIPTPAGSVAPASSISTSEPTTTIQQTTRYKRMPLFSRSKGDILCKELLLGTGKLDFTYRVTSGQLEVLVLERKHFLPFYHHSRLDEIRSAVIQMRDDSINHLNRDILEFLPSNTIKDPYAAPPPALKIEQHVRAGEQVWKAVAHELEVWIVEQEQEVPTSSKHSHGNKKMISHRSNTSSRSVSTNRSTKTTTSASQMHQSSAYAKQQQMARMQRAKMKLKERGSEIAATASSAASSSSTAATATSHSHLNYAAIGMKSGGVMITREIQQEGEGVHVPRIHAYFTTFTM